MGISGLLPLLKSIQASKHLSEFAGQTLAVDAYVWLHRGVYSCATELATGKRTTKYVDYAMHRIRMLRHHHIEPYVVFDGGPLPAKMGTEAGRRKKREDNLARGNALAAQGKHAQAREYYVKCVDVTPQMAFQLIKALRAESVPYVVAPYEADAQMAYLERIGLVDGIITEDSDLLVFGCRVVLFKFDAASSTITEIRRKDFASTTTSDGGISLLGWSDVEFRAMTILSGCDYLPSIPGIGLKTAWSLLKKHKTVENVVKAIRVEGKKTVPKGYLEQYKLAEKVFLHQRVYDPISERLVHLTDVPAGQSWNEEHEAYVGSDMEPYLAQKLARGDIDPITLVQIEDINPDFVPRPLRATLPLVSTDMNKDKGKGKAPRKSHSEGILCFFGPNPKIPPAPKLCSEPALSSNMIVGRASGKRTLTEVLDHDIEAKRKKKTPEAKISVPSRFFAPTAAQEHATHVDPSLAVAEKENTPVSTNGLEDDFIIESQQVFDPVTQEDGYLSISPSSSRCVTPDLSSPVRPLNPEEQEVDIATQDFFEVDAISSPPSIRKRSYDCRPNLIEHPTVRTDRVQKTNVSAFIGPDLCDSFRDVSPSDIDAFEEDEHTPGTDPPSPVSSGGTGQDGNVAIIAGDGDLDMESDSAEIVAEAFACRYEVVAKGWWQKWARGNRSHGKGSMHSGDATLRRHDTSVTPDGRHSVRRNIQASSGSTRRLSSAQSLSRLPSLTRKSLAFDDNVNVKAKSAGTNAEPARKLAQFRSDIRTLQ